MKSGNRLDVANVPNLDAIRALPAPPKLTPNIPVISQAMITQSASGNQPASGNRSSSVAEQKTVNVRFSLPNSEPVSGQFAEGDVSKMLQMLKDAGVRSM